MAGSCWCMAETNTICKTIIFQLKINKFKKKDVVDPGHGLSMVLLCIQQTEATASHKYNERTGT